MPGFVHFMRCVGNAAVKNGGRALAGLVPFGEVLYEIATTAYEDYRRDHGEAELRAELQGIAQASPAEVHQAAEQIAAKEPVEIRQALMSYLEQLPAAVHQSLRRPSDPGGTTVPSNRPLGKPEDLLAFLPAGLPRFKPGDQPLAADWELVEMLGKGGFGEVWKARHLMRTAQKPVALKFCLDPVAARTLRNEATLHDVLDRVRCQGGAKGVVRLLETYLRSDPPCLMYEYIEGGDLTGFILEMHQNGKLTPDLATRIVQYLASTVAFAHGLTPPLVHRDLKPSNVLVRRGEGNKLSLFVADFGIGGLAARQSLHEQANHRSIRSQTLPTAVRGAYTPLYASPQQVQGAPPDPRDDVHALGVIWYQLVTGDLKLMAIPPDWRDVVEERGMGQEQVRLLASCLASRSEKRLASAADLTERLTALREQETACVAAEQKRREQEEEEVRRAEQVRRVQEESVRRWEGLERLRREQAAREEAQRQFVEEARRQEEAGRQQRETEERVLREQRAAERKREEERQQREEEARQAAEKERREREEAARRQVEERERLSQLEAARKQAEEALRQRTEETRRQEEQKREQQDAARQLREQEERQRNEAPAVRGQDKPAAVPTKAGQSTTAQYTPAPPAEDSIDKPACFYLGREYDLATKKVLPDKLIFYDARNLTTHGVIVGMTGSGKTGLSIALLEEAAIDGVPAVIIDPKGELTNLLLQFPDLSPQSFAEWLNPDDARQKNLSVEEYARQLSERWRQGLIDSKQPPDRAREMSNVTDFRIYTPGSEAGVQLSILGIFAAPKTRMKAEDLNQKINATATALLDLSGITADPMQSREHVLIAQLLNHAWSNGKDLDLPGLIKEVQTPSIHTVGAYNLETFFPAKERLKFASQLNNMLASPMFTTWTRGEPLDLASMLYRNGRPQHLIFYCAHLDDNQRMFFTTLLLEEMLNWTRRQSATTSLRALLFFDQVFGYLPPHPANPPSKLPLLRLLKEGRAAGVGVLLATQNPVDLDYKALSNAGAWFVGRLQTERDRARLLDGLESVAAEYGTMTDRGYLEKVIASLGNRIFLMHNINQGQPKLFQCRWALSFLRGPMTRDEVTRCVEGIKKRDAAGGVIAMKLCNHCGAEVPAGVGNRCPSCGKNPWDPAVGGAAPVAKVATAVAAGPGGKAPAAPVAKQTGGEVRYTQPVLPPDVNQFYIPVAAGSGKPGQELEYQPWVLGFADMVFQIDRRTGSEHKVKLRLLAPVPERGHPVDWDKAMAIGIVPAPKPEARARWAAVPESLDTGRKLKALEKAFNEHLDSTQRMSLFENRGLEMVSKPGEALDAFRRRCKQVAEQQCKQAKEMETVKFTPKIDAAKQSTSKGREDRIAKLETDLQAKQDELSEKYRRIGEEATPIQLKPRKGDIRVTHFGLAWAPFWRAPLAT